MKFETVAVVGATGAVGRIIRELLESRDFPAGRVRFLATARSAGTAVAFRGGDVTVEEVSPAAFAGCDLVIASTPDDAARDLLPHALRAGAVVIDESGYWRMRDDVALVVPEINGHAALGAAREGRLIASPNCSTTQLVQCLKPLHDAAGLRRVVVSTYQAVSGAGLAGTEELRDSVRARLDDAAFEPRVFQRPIGFNLIPQIGSFKEGRFDGRRRGRRLHLRGDENGPRDPQDHGFARPEGERHLRPRAGGGLPQRNRSPASSTGRSARPKPARRWRRSPAWR